MTEQTQRPDDLPSLPNHPKAIGATDILEHAGDELRRVANARDRAAQVEINTVLLAGIFEMMRVQQGTLTDIRAALQPIGDSMQGDLQDASRSLIRMQDRLPDAAERAAWEGSLQRIDGTLAAIWCILDGKPSPVEQAKAQSGIWRDSPRAAFPDPGDVDQVPAGVAIARKGDGSFYGRWLADHDARPTEEEGAQFVTMRRHRHSSLVNLLTFAVKHGCEAKIDAGTLIVRTTDDGLLRSVGIGESLVIRYLPDTPLRDVLVVDDGRFALMKAATGESRYHRTTHADIETAKGREQPLVPGAAFVASRVEATRVTLTPGNIRALQARFPTRYGDDRKLQVRCDAEMGAGWFVPREGEILVRLVDTGRIEKWQVERACADQYPFAVWLPTELPEPPPAYAAPIVSHPNYDAQRKSFLSEGTKVGAVGAKLPAIEPSLREAAYRDGAFDWRKDQEAVVSSYARLAEAVGYSERDEIEAHCAEPPQQLGQQDSLDEAGEDADIMDTPDGPVVVSAHLVASPEQVVALEERQRGDDPFVCLHINGDPKPTRYTPMPNGWTCATCGYHVAYTADDLPAVERSDPEQVADARTAHDKARPVRMTGEARPEPAAFVSHDDAQRRKDIEALACLLYETRWPDAPRTEPRPMPDGNGMAQLPAWFVITDEARRNFRVMAEAALAFCTERSTVLQAVRSAGAGDADALWAAGKDRIRKRLAYMEEAVRDRTATGGAVSASYERGARDAYRRALQYLNGER